MTLTYIKNKIYTGFIPGSLYINGRAIYAFNIEPKVSSLPEEYYEEHLVSYSNVFIL